MTTYLYDCPTCRYHKTYKDTEPVGALCLHPAGEQYRNDNERELITICNGWIANK